MESQEIVQLPQKKKLNLFFCNLISLNDIGLLKFMNISEKFKVSS